MPISITTWDAWKNAHPDTVYVDLPPTGFRDEMMTTLLDWMIPLTALSKRKPPWHPMNGDLDSRLPAMTMVVGVGRQTNAAPIRSTTCGSEASSTTRSVARRSC